MAEDIEQLASRRGIYIRRLFFANNRLLTFNIFQHAPQSDNTLATSIERTTQTLQYLER